mgnify:FL=1
MFKSEPQKQADEMKSSKYKLLILSVFAAFILCAAAYILFISKTDYLKIFVVYYKPAPLIKTEIFETRMSEIISVLFDVRTDSDYDDFFVISKADTAAQIENAAYFVDRIELYLNTR